MPERGVAYKYLLYRLYVSTYGIEGKFWNSRGITKPVLSAQYQDFGIWSYQHLESRHTTVQRTQVHSHQFPGGGWGRGFDFQREYVDWLRTGTGGGHFWMR